MIEVDVTSPIIEILNQYGFATVAAVAMGYFIYFIYSFVTEKIIENPTDMPSIFTKNKSNEIMSGLRFENVKRNEIRRIKRMK